MSSEPGCGSTDLWDRLTRSGGVHRSSSIHCWVGDRYESSPWTAVAGNAEAMTAGLRRAGVAPGARVATVMTNSPGAIRGLLGVWLAGGTVASLPVPARGMSPGEYARQLTAAAAALDPVVFLVEERMMGLIPEDLRARFRLRSFESFADSGRVGAAPPDADEPAFVQYSSGSTSTPKGCVLTPRAISAQLDIVATMIDIRPHRDVAVTWLPLSHDMGLFGFLLTCWWSDVECYLSTPERFMFAPGTWFSDVAGFGWHADGGQQHRPVLGGAFRLPARRGCGHTAWRMPGSASLARNVSSGTPCGTRRMRWLRTVSRRPR